LFLSLIVAAKTAELFIHKISGLIFYCLFIRLLVKFIVLARGGMTMYAVIMSGGKQYRVSEGDVIRVEKLNAEVDAPVEFKDVLLVKTDEKTDIGNPLVEGASVEGILRAQEKSDKILVFKYKKKKQYRRTRGHRQQYSEVLIEKINSGSM
jgi:large subunit ribosomal protein L21